MHERAGLQVCSARAAEAKDRVLPSGAPSQRVSAARKAAMTMTAMYGISSFEPASLPSMSLMKSPVPPARTAMITKNADTQPDFCGAACVCM